LLIKASSKKVPNDLPVPNPEKFYNILYIKSGTMGRRYSPPTSPLILNYYKFARQLVKIQFCKESLARQAALVFLVVVLILLGNQPRKSFCLPHCTGKEKLLDAVLEKGCPFIRAAQAFTFIKLVIRQSRKN
jgi:hypothetical protein